MRLGILEHTDEQLLRRILEAPVSTPKCMLYLDSGCKPIRFVCMSRRLLFLHYILNEDDQSLIYKFYRAQESKSNSNDWCRTVQENLEFLEIMLTSDQIKMCSKQQFKTLVNSSIEEKCLNYLNKEKEKLSKVGHVSHSELKLQNYLQPNKCNNNIAKFTFLLRSRMLEVGSNFKNKFENNFCPICEDKTTKDSQQHMMICPLLMKNQISKNILRYDSLFEDCVEKQLEVAKLIETNYRKRKEILKTK